MKKVLDSLPPALDTVNTGENSDIERQSADQIARISHMLVGLALKEDSGTNRSNSVVSVGLAQNGDMQLRTPNREGTGSQVLRIANNNDVFMDDGIADGRKKKSRTSLGTQKTPNAHHVYYDKPSSEEGVSEGSHHWVRKGTTKSARKEAANQLGRMRSQLSRDRANEKKRKSLN